MSNLNVALPAGMTPEEAAKILQDAATARASAPPRTRKRRRGIPAATTTATGDDLEDEEFEDQYGYSSLLWKTHNVQARLSWARYFSFPTEAGVNKVIVNAMGPEIMDEENTMAYDNAFEKIKSWSRQWQYDVLKKLTKHVRKVSATDHKIKLLILVKVRSIWDTEKEIMSDMNPSGLRKHFFRKLNVPTIKEIFHVIDVVVDLDEIFSSAASGLYTTVYANMAAYTLVTGMPGHARKDQTEGRVRIGEPGSPAYYPLIRR
jgi:hypothetical protein